MLFGFVSIVLLKAYAIGIIWRCYKFLTMRQHNLQSMLPYIVPDASDFHQDRDYNSFLPDYEEAVLKQPPPNYHSAAMANRCAATIVLPPETFVSSSTSRFFETTAMHPPPAYSTLQWNSNLIINNIAESNEITSTIERHLPSQLRNHNIEIASLNQTEAALVKNDQISNHISTTMQEVK